MVQLFVYGTLKPGEAYYQQYCEPYVLEATPALARGQLFHLPEGYPAMAEGEGWVTGAVLTLVEGAIAHMDAFEDYDPALPEADNLYSRKRCPVFSSDRQSLGLAWMYIMAPERVHHCGGILIPSGIWSRQQWHSIYPSEPG